MSADQEQLDRIEAKLDRLNGLLDAAVKLALPRMPAAAREMALKLLAGRSGG